MVALLVRGSILVANCGDSRAVLCRAGNALPLSQDHKVRIIVSCVSYFSPLVSLAGQI